MPAPESALTRALSRWPDWCQCEPELVRALDNGASNQAFLVRVNEQPQVLRLLDPARGALGVSTARERDVTVAAAEQGLAPRWIYSDPGEAFNITAYIAGHHWQPEDFQAPRQVDRLARLLRSIHALSPAPGLEVLDSWQRAKRYQSLLRPDGPVPSVLKDIEALLAPVLGQYPAASEALTLCHGDLLPGNILDEGDRLMAVDWEYAVLANPLFDLAVIIEGNQLDDTFATRLIASYLDNNTVYSWSALQRQRLAYCYLDLLWWCVKWGPAVDNHLPAIHRKQARIIQLFNCL